MHHEQGYLFMKKSPLNPNFDTKFVTAGGTVPKLHNIVYMHVGPNGSKMWFCVQN